MNARTRQPNSSGQFCVLHPAAETEAGADRKSEQKLFTRGVLQLQVTCGKCLKLPQNGLANAIPYELRLDRWQHGVMAIGPSPLLQHLQLLGLSLQILENSGKQNTDEVLQSDVLLNISRVSGFPSRALRSLSANGQMKQSSRLVPTEVVRQTANDLLQVIKEIPVVRKVFPGNGATSSRGSSTKLNCGDRRIDQFFPAGASQVSCQARIVSQVFQKALCQPRELPPLLVRYRRKRVVYVRKGPVLLLLLIPVLRFFSLHRKRAFGAFLREGRWQLELPNGYSYDVD